MNKGRIWLNIRDSFWFIPTVYSIISFLAVIGTSYLDLWVVSEFKNSFPRFLLTEKSVAQTIYGSMVTAILTMTTISFSTIMVVLTTYTTQFSPRTLQDFMKSRVTQHVLGVFSFGFIFSLMNLFLLGKEQMGLFSPLFTVIVSTICLAFFILFIHHSSKFLKVNNLIGEIRLSASKLIQKIFKEKDYNEKAEWEEEEIETLKRSGKRGYITSNESGYVQEVQFRSLINWAKRNDMLLKANFYIGDYVPKGMTVFYFWKQNDQELNTDEYTEHVLIGNERVDAQDIEFAIQKLVEIAVRAISPSLNDPHTATNCINRIGSLLTELGAVYEPIRYYADENHQLRLIMEPMTYKEYLYKSFYQIRTYGYHDISVMNGVIEALYKIALTLKGDKCDDVWEIGLYMIKAVDVKELNEMDFNHFNKKVQKLAKACDKEIELRAH